VKIFWKLRFSPMRVRWLQEFVSFHFRQFKSRAANAAKRSKIGQTLIGTADNVR